MKEENGTRVSTREKALPDSKFTPIEVHVQYTCSAVTYESHYDLAPPTASKEMSTVSSVFG